MKILCFAAALRKDSFNRKLMVQMVDVLGASSGVEIDHADYREFEMPIYDGDVEESSGIPKGGLELIRRLQFAQAVVISTPEYNGGIPGTLKNAIDWASRAEDNPFEGKPLLLLSASPGGLGGVRSLWHTRVPLEALGAVVFPEMFGLSRAHQAFDKAGAFADAKNRERIRILAESFLGFARRLASK